MSHPEIPNWTIWEVLFGLVVFVIDIGICVFFIELLSGYFHGGKK